MESIEDSTPCKGIPAQLLVPAAPIFADDPAESESQEGGPEGGSKARYITGLHTLPTSWGAALERADGLLKRCRELVRRANWREFIRLLQEHPELTADAEVQDALDRLAQTGRLRNPRGRGFGSFEVHPLWIVGMVEQRLRSGQADDHEQAFVQVAQLCGQSFESVRTTFYRARSEPRFQGLMIKFPRGVSQEAQHSSGPSSQPAEPLLSGSKAVRHVDHPGLGPTEITFEDVPVVPKAKRPTRPSDAQKGPKVDAKYSWLYGKPKRR